MGGLSSLGWDERAVRGVAEVSVPGCAAGRVVRVDLDSVVVSTEGGDRRARARELPTVGDWVVADVQEQGALSSAWLGAGPSCPAETPRAAPRCWRRMSTWSWSRHRRTGCRWHAWSARSLWDGTVARDPWCSSPSPIWPPRDCSRSSRSRLVGVEVVPVSTVTGVGAAHVAEMLRPAPHGGPARTLRGRQVLVGQLAARAWGSAHGTGPSRRPPGRHMTSSRGLYAVPTGGVIIDTPGLRSLSLTIDQGGVTAAFPDIEALAPNVGSRTADTSMSRTVLCLPPSRTKGSTGIAWRTIESSGESSSSSCGGTIRPQPGRTDGSGRQEQVRPTAPPGARVLTLLPEPNRKRPKRGRRLDRGRRSGLRVTQNVTQNVGRGRVLSGQAGKPETPGTGVRRLRRRGTTWSDVDRNRRLGRLPGRGCRIRQRLGMVNRLASHRRQFPIGRSRQ